MDGSYSQSAEENMLDRNLAMFMNDWLLSAGLETKTVIVTVCRAVNDGSGGTGWLVPNNTQLTGQLANYMVSNILELADNIQGADIAWPTVPFLTPTGSIFVAKAGSETGNTWKYVLTLRNAEATKAWMLEQGPNGQAAWDALQPLSQRSSIPPSSFGPQRTQTGRGRYQRQHSSAWTSLSSLPEVASTPSNNLGSSGIGNGSELTVDNSRYDGVPSGPDSVQFAAYPYHPGNSGMLSIQAPQTVVPDESSGSASYYN